MRLSYNPFHVHIHRVRPTRIEAHHYAQNWVDIAPPLKQPLEVITARTPFELMFDLRGLDASDLVEISVQLGLRKRTDPSQLDWVVSEQYSIGVVQTPGESHLMINGADSSGLGSSRLVAITPQHGPWPAKVLYTHHRSMTKLVRFIVIEGDRRLLGNGG